MSAPVQRDGFADERLERRGVDRVGFAEVDRAAGVALETRVEEALRVLEARALEESQLDGLLVALAGADDPAVGPDRHGPLPLLGHRRIGLVDQGAKAGERLAAPVAQLRDPLVDQTGGGPGVLRLHSAGLLHHCPQVSWVSWIRLPQVSSSCAMTEPVTAVAGMVNVTPFAARRSCSA